MGVCVPHAKCSTLGCMVARLHESGLEVHAAQPASASLSHTVTAPLRVTWHAKHCLKLRGNSGAALHAWGPC